MTKLTDPRQVMVYTALMGPHDAPKPFPEPDRLLCRAVLYTDQEALLDGGVEGWEVHRLTAPEVAPTKSFHHFSPCLG